LFIKKAINVYALSGYPDLFVSFKISRPSTSRNTWYSNTTGSDTLTIFSNDFNYTVGRLFIGVYGFQSATYILSVTIGKNYEITNGASVAGFVLPLEYSFYYFSTDQFVNNQSIAIFNNYNGFGQVTLYASISSTRPSSSVYDWYYSTTSSTQTLIINPRDPKFPSKILFISVYGRMRSSYNINVYTPAETPQTIVNGFGFSNSLRVNTFNYNIFTFDSFTANLPFVLELNPSTKSEIRICASFDSLRPSEKNYQWTGINRLILDHVTLKPGNMYISYTPNVNTGYTGIAYSGENMYNLKNASNFDNSIYEYQYQYYYIMVPDIFFFTNIRLRSSLGINGLYASRLTTRPSSVWFTWRSATAYPTQSIDISPADRDFGVGPLYISVYGQTNSRYTLSVTLIPA